MATAETARLIASLELQGQKFDAGIGKALSGIDRIDKRFEKSAGLWKHTLSTAFGVGLERAVSAGVRGVFGALQGGVAALQEQGKVVAQTNAAIKSTGGAANVTAAEIRSLSEATEKKTAIDDKQIQTAANLLLTFTNVRNETGKGNDIFNQSVAILADLATAMGTDASSGAIQLGKALNDPVKGITALTRIGVTFDATQKKQIENFVKAGKVAEAQKIILAELNKEFGGSGAAFAATDAGKAAQFADAVEDIQKAFASGLLPAITRVRGALTAFLSDPATTGQVEQLGNAIASIFSEGNIRTAANLMTTAAGAIGTAIKLFSGLPKEVQALAVGAIALKKFTGIGITDIAKTIGGELFKRGGTPANPLFVSDVTGGLGAGALGKGAGSLLPAAGVAGIILALAIPIGEAVRDALPPELKGEGGRGESDSQRSQRLQREAREERDRLDRLIKSTDDRGREHRDALVRLVQRTDDRGREAKDALKAIDATTSAMNVQLHADLQAAISSLDTNLPGALEGIIKAIRGGAGSGKTTGDIVADLKSRRDAALKAGDKATARALEDAIKRIEPFAKGRQWQKEQIDKAREIVASNKSTADKVDALKGIESDLLSHQRTMAAGIVSGLENVVTAIKNIKLPAGSSPKVNESTGFVIPGGVPLPKPSPGATPKVNSQTGFVVNANVSVSTRDIKNAQIIRGRMGAVPVEAGSA